MNRRVKSLLFVVLAIFVVIIGWHGVTRLISPWTVIRTLTLTTPAANSPLAQPLTLRVGTYNIAHGRGGEFGASNWDGGNRAETMARMKRIGQLLKAKQLDIVVLNEVDFSSVWSGHLDQARLIAEQAGFPYFVEQRNMDAAIPLARICFGNAILSKFPLSDARLIDFPSGYSTWVELAVGGIKEGVVSTVSLPDGSQVRIFATHLHPEKEAVRVESARMMLKAAQESDIPMIALGDFNAAPTGYPTAETDASGVNTMDLFFANQRFTTLPMGLPVNPNDFTFPSVKPNQVIDWIVVSSPWKIAEREVLQSHDSDHLPVIARLHREES